MTNWNERMMDLDRMDTDRLRVEEGRVSHSVVSIAERREALYELAESLGIVSALESVNRDLWTGLGDIAVVEDSRAVDREKRGRSLDFNLTHPVNSYSEKREDITQQVFGIYTEEYNSGDPRNHFVESHTARGWHTVVIGERVLEPLLHSYSHTQKVELVPSSDFSNFRIYLYDPLVNLARDYPGEKFIIQSKSSAGDPKRGAIIDKPDMNRISIFAHYTPEEIAQAREHLLTAMAWLNREKGKNGTLPQDYKKKEELSLIEAAKRVGETFYY